MCKVPSGFWNSWKFVVGVLDKFKKRTDSFTQDNFGLRLLRAVFSMIYALLHMLPAD